MGKKHIGSRFDDFLAEEAILEETTAAAIKRVTAWQIAKGNGRSTAHQDCAGQKDAYESCGVKSTAG